MAVPDAPAPTITSTSFDSITVDLGASNTDFDRDLAIREGSVSASDPAAGDIVDTVPGTTTTYTFDQLAGGAGLQPDTTYTLSQRFKAPGA